MAVVVLRALQMIRVTRPAVGPGTGERSIARSHPTLAAGTTPSSGWSAGRSSSKLVVPASGMSSVTRNVSTPLPPAGSLLGETPTSANAGPAPVRLSASPRPSTADREPRRVVPGAIRTCPHSGRRSPEGPSSWRVDLAHHRDLSRIAPSRATPVPRVRPPRGVPHRPGPFGEHSGPDQYNRELPRLCHAPLLAVRPVCPTPSCGGEVGRGARVGRPDETGPPWTPTTSPNWRLPPGGAIRPRRPNSSEPPRATSGGTSPTWSTGRTPTT